MKALMTLSLLSREALKKNYGPMNVWPCVHLPEANGPMDGRQAGRAASGQWPVTKNPKKNHWSELSRVTCSGKLRCLKHST